MRNNNSSGELWPIHLKPKHDEILSSWLVRLSMAHGLNLTSFLSGTFKTPKRFTANIDTSVDDSMLQILSSKTGIPMDRIIATTLRSYEGVLFRSIKDKSDKTWIMPIGTNHLTFHGQQFCPICLSEDKESYFRRSWRLAFVFICLKHQVQLLDKCPACNAAVVFSRLIIDEECNLSAYSNTSCYRCKMDLRLGADMGKHLLPLCDEAIRFQKFLISVLTNGWAEICRDEWVYSLLFFEGLHHLLDLFSRGPAAHKLRNNATKYYSVEKFKFRKPSKGRSHMEFLSVATRRSLLSISERLLRNWPDEFIKFCRLNKLTRITLLRSKLPVPFWYWKVIHDHFTYTKHKTTDEEVESALHYMEKLSQQYNGKLLTTYPPEMKAISNFLNRARTSDYYYSNKWPDMKRTINWKTKGWAGNCVR